VPKPTKPQTVFSGPVLFPRQRDLMSAMTAHRYSLAYGSSRGGKSYAIAAFIISRALKYPKSNHLVVRLTGLSIKTTIWKTFEAVLADFGINDKVSKNTTEYIMTFPDNLGGSTIVMSGVQDEERIQKVLGAEYQTIFYNEGTNIDWETFEVVDSRLNNSDAPDCPLRCIADCNPTSKKHWLYQLMIAHTVPGTKRPITDPENYGSIHFDAEANPTVDSEYYTKFQNRSAATQKRFREGMWSDEVQGALFAQDDLDDNRAPTPEADEFDLIVVGVDPAVTNTETSDETGIVVAGMIDDGESRHYYPLEDLSGRYHPWEWADKVADAYRRWGAGMVVVETTQGGDQNAHTLRTADASLNIMTVNPGRGQGKNARAFPIAAEMKSKRIHHPLDDTKFKELESQMLTITGDYDRRKGKSPDHLDAYVYAISELLTGDGPNKPVVVSKIAGWFR
jgi:phage terminase large subunit-like protein